MRLIDADALLQTFCAECNHTIKCEDCDIEYHITHAPTIEAELVKRGKWFYDEIADEYLVYRCSACDIPSDLDTPYCPWCGAKMENPE